METTGLSLARSVSGVCDGPVEDWLDRFVDSVAEVERN